MRLPRGTSTRPFSLRALTLRAAALAACGLLAGCAGTTVSPGSAAESGAADALQTPAVAGESPVVDALYRCITARGWQVTLTDDGAIQASSDTIPKEQYQLYLSDTWACNAQVAKQFPVDDNQKHLLYAAELAERACLQQHGYSVDEPPSLQQFLDTYDSAPWSAMASSELATLSQTMSDADWRSINLACPQPVPGTLH
ncbi:hypothetical protein [Subtercola lobariae]|uniref:DUF2599 domain-containing protein n=1 Tax=Subtercola lobariae TaxID=1588641 RepID=A0A917BC94_9MICO|nr:hypothetical protein [Subtercola lobariae]GGF33697.1 hypothetical protein GCM10011399_28560 [Subtercola lobariae]